MNHTEFAVSRFENSNGVTSWRVSGWLHGVRIRKNYKTREEAAAEKAALELKAVQDANGMRPVATTLTHEQVRDAEAAFRRLLGNARPLAFYLDFALANYREPEQRKKAKAAVGDYLAAKERELTQDQLSRPQMERIRSELKRFLAHFGNESLDELTPPRVVAYLEIGNGGLKTWNNRRGVISTFFRFAYYRGWVAENPLARIPQNRIRQRRGMAATLDVAKARELMAFLEDYQGGKFVPYYALCLFAGIRPGVPYGEIKKLKPEAVNLETGIIHIAAEVSKTREPRRVSIQPNLAAWLRAYPLDKFPIVVGNFQKKRAKFAKRFQLTHDVLRHTFISMFVAKYRSIGEAAIQAGNSENIIRRHYLDLKTPTEAEEFFGILPKCAIAASADAKIILFPAGSPLPISR